MTLMGRVLKSHTQYNLGGQIVDIDCSPAGVSPQALCQKHGSNNPRVERRCKNHNQVSLLNSGLMQHWYQIITVIIAQAVTVLY